MKIDYVIAWVDGSDPAHAAARRRFRPDACNTHTEATTEARFHDSGELYYQIASILKYAPFIRRVHIVTDNQTPPLLDSFAKAGLCDCSFLNVVSHDTIFEGLEATRPTFNSLAIEAALWRIPDLADHFIYANDDFFLNAHLTPADFFRDGKPVVHGEWVKPDHRRLKIKIRKVMRKITGRRNIRPSFRIAQEQGAVLAGMTENFLHIHHHPHALRRSTIAEFYRENMAVLRRQVGFRFRKVEQYMPVALSNHLEISRHAVVPEPPKAVAYTTPDMKKPIGPILDLMRTDAAPFGCIQSMESYPPALCGELHKILQDKFAETLPPAILQLSRTALCQTEREKEPVFEPAIEAKSAA